MRQRGPDMIYYDPDDRSYPLDADAFRNAGGDRASGLPPASEQRTLDEVADALNITTALLRQGAQSELVDGGPASLVEASALLQAFIRIEDPDVRQGCLACVQAAAARE